MKDIFRCISEHMPEHTLVESILTKKESKMEFLKTRNGKVALLIGGFIVLAVLLYFGVDGDVASNLNQ